MPDDNTIQAEEGLETADEITPDETVDDVVDSPSDTVESEQTTGETVDDGVDDSTDEEYEPFKHTVKYTASGEDRDFDLEYDKDGNLTPETTERLTGVLAKTGLEKVAQEKHEKWQSADRQAQAAAARVKFLEGQLAKVEAEYQKPIDFIKDNPVLARVMQQGRVPLPNIERIRLDREKSQVASERRELESREFFGHIVQAVASKYPDFEYDQYDQIGRELSDTSLMRRIHEDTKTPLKKSIPDVLREADLIVAKLTMEGKLPNSALEQARKSTENARQETKATKERALKRQAVVNPLAGGRPRGTKGKGKTDVDPTGWTPQEYATWVNTGKAPAR